MGKVALFLAGILLGLFFGRFYPLVRAPLQYPHPNYPEHGYYAPDGDQEWDPCGGVAKASQPWHSKIELSRELSAVRPESLAAVVQPSTPVRF